jgi:hypothetical protein
MEPTIMNELLDAFSRTFGEDYVRPVPDDTEHKMQDPIQDDEAEERKKT